MPYPLSPLLSSIALLLLLGVLAQSTMADENEDRKKLKSISADIHKVEKTLKRSASEREKLTHQLRKTELERASLEKGINQIESQLNGLQQDLKELNTDQSKLQADEKRQQQLLQTQINAAYRLGREEPVKLFLNQEDPSRLSRTMKYYNYFLTARAEKLNNYIATLNTLAEIEESIALKTERLTLRRDQQSKQQQQLADRQKQRKHLMAQLHQQISTNQQKLSSLQQERDRLNAVLEAIKKAVGDIPTPHSQQPFLTAKGKMQWPVKGQLQHSFGSQRNAKMKWDGWLLATREGVAVKAIHSGRVVFSDYLRGYGLLVIIDHGDNYMSLYAHNQVLLKEAGDWVSSHDVVARAGNSGGQIEPGLYFEIRHKGKPTNPRNWLARR